MYTAIIIEPRKHLAMEFVLENFMENLDERWSFIIFHGTQNEKWLIEILNRNKNISKHHKRITLQNLGVENLTWNEYCSLMANYDFINSIPTEVFLVFQTDTMICKPYKDLIYDYIDYDYVGAPWNDGGVGNGGLSLRRKTKMLEIIKTVPYTIGYAEDHYFYTSGMMKVPTFEKAKEFSIEQVYSVRSFGIHKPWKYIGGIIEEQCPGYSELVRLNNYR